VLARDGLADAARRIGRLAITEQMMTLAMPDGRMLRLGHDLDATFPEVLRGVRLPELAALLARVDPTPDSVAETGTADWGVLSDRMHFIADLFRAYHLGRRCSMIPSPLSRRRRSRRAGDRKASYNPCDSAPATPYASANLHADGQRHRSRHAVVEHTSEERRDLVAAGKPRARRAGQPDHQITNARPLLVRSALQPARSIQ
jgi:hypothetical protein